MDYLKSILSQDFMPHGYCLRWQPDVFYLNLVSDLFIAAAYYLIPGALVYFLWKRKNVAFPGLFILFGVFILACGTTHVLEVVTLWHPFYRLEGLVKAITALSSVATAVVLYPLIPRLLRLRSVSELEDRLRATEENLGVLVENLSDYAIYLLDPAGSIVSWNQGAERVTGYRAEDITGKTHALLFPAADRGAGQPARELEIAAREGRFEGEAPRVRKDGSTFWAHIVVVPLHGKGGEVSGYGKILRDITERKRIESELERSSDRYRSLVLASSQIVWTASAGGEVVEDLPSWREYTGQSREEIRGRGWAAAVHPDDVPRVGEIWGRSIATGTPHEQEFRVRRRDGEYRLMLAKAVPVRDPDGSVREWVGTCLDVTEQREQEKALAQSQEQLRQAQKMDAIGRLAGGVAHDFNNILTAVNGYLSLLTVQMPPDSPWQENVREALKAAERAAVLTKQLLSFSRKSIAVPVTVDVNHVVEDMGGMLKRLLGADVELELHLDPGAGRIRLESGQLEQILLNLAVNARDAIGVRGKLTVETSRVDLGGELIGARKNLKPGSYAMLAVSDDGAGMSEDVKARLFEPFFTTKTAGHGTGLGLSIVYGAVRQAGGDILVYSEPGKGTTFKLYFPILEGAAEEAAKSAPRSESIPKGTERILLVEDEGPVRGLISLVLRSAGYEVLEAAGGAEALRLAKAALGPPQLLLTDVVMEGMGGREVAEALQRDFPGLRVLYMSGYTDDTVLRHGLLTSTLAFLEKPFSPAQLAQAVRAALEAQPVQGDSPARAEG